MNEEILAKARTAGSPEELLKIAQEGGIEGITEENAGEYFRLMHKSGEIPDDELKGTSGGAAYDSEGCLIVTEGNLCRQRNKKSIWRCKKCHQDESHCNCYPEPTEFEDFWGVVIRKTKESCGTCDFLHSNPNKLYFYCSQLGNW